MSSLFFKVRGSGEARKEREKTNVTFRITLPVGISPQTVHVLGSWDKFRTAYPLEPDPKVGRGVWKGMLSDKAGLEMGTEHTYYFLLDSRESIPDPCSPPDEIAVDSKGRLVSCLYVPIEIPPSPDPPGPPRRIRRSMIVHMSNHSLHDPDMMGSSGGMRKVDFSNGDRFMDMGHSYDAVNRQQPNDVAFVDKGGSSLRQRMRGRNSRLSLAGVFGNGQERDMNSGMDYKRKWSLSRGFLKNKGSLRTQIPHDFFHQAEDGLTPKETASPLESIAAGCGDAPRDYSDITGYLREEDTTMADAEPPRPPTAHYYSPLSNITSYSPTDFRQAPATLPGNIPGVNKCSIATDASHTPSLSLSCSIETNPSFEDTYAPTISPSEPIPDFFSPSGSDTTEDEADDEACEVTTPLDGHALDTRRPSSSSTAQPGAFPKHYNFDEISGVSGGNRYIGRYAGDVILSECTQGVTEGAIKPLGCLREEVAGEIAWREQVMNELGYLGSVVI